VRTRRLPGLVAPPEAYATAAAALRTLRNFRGAQEGEELWARPGGRPTPCAAPRSRGTSKL